MAAALSCRMSCGMPLPCVSCGARVGAWREDGCRAGLSDELRHAHPHPRQCEIRVVRDNYKASRDQPVGEGDEYALLTTPQPWQSPI